MELFSSLFSTKLQITKAGPVFHMAQEKKIRVI